MPSLNSDEVSDQLPDESTVVEAIVVTPLSTSSTVALASTVPLNVGVESLVKLSVFEDPLSDDETRSGVEGVLEHPVALS